MTKRDYYEVLEIDRTANNEEIKRAYYKKAKTCHPDAFPGKEDQFKELQEAYSILSNPEKRNMYDKFGHNGPSSLGGFSGGGHDPFSDFFEDISSIFEDFFGFGGGTRSKNRPRKGSDLKYHLMIDLEDAALGKEIKIDVEKTENCRKCNGTGSKDGTEAERCPKCAGRGKLSMSQGLFTFATTCTYCSGTGRVIRNKCSDCKGKGIRKTEKELSIKIPSGIKSGMKLRMEHEGEAGINGGPPGDLYIFVEVKEHPYFIRMGDDLVCELVISIWQAALGDEITIKTLTDETLKVKIPPGTQNGDTFKLRNKGMPNMQVMSNGNLIISVSVEVPEKLNNKEREVLEQFATGRDEEILQKKSIYEKLKETFS